MSKTLEESAGVLLSLMAQTARGAQDGPRVALGVVTAGTREGLKITCGGDVLTAEELWAPADLLEGYSPKLTGTLSGTCSHGGTTTPVTGDQLTRSEFGLSVGDRVILFTPDDQDYYILCKAVRLL